VLIPFFLLALGGLFSPPALALALALVLAALASLGTDIWRTALSHPLVIGALGLGALVVVRTWLPDGYEFVPNSVARDTSDVWDYIRISGPFAAIFGVTLALDPSKRYWLLATFVIGWLLFLGHELDFEDLIESYSDRRHQLDSETVGSTEIGMFSGISLVTGLGCLVGGVQSVGQHQRLKGTVIVLLGATATVSAGVTLLLSGSRSSWIGAAVVVPLMLFAWAFMAVRRSNLSKRKVYIALAGTFTVMAIAVGGAHDRIISRFGQDLNVAKQILSGDTADIEPSGSWSKRYVMYTEGLQIIGERPLTGFGPDRVRQIRQYHPSERIYGSGHFHNLFITASVAMGAAWTLLWCAWLGGLIWLGTRGFARSLDDPIFAYTAGALLAFYLVTAQFQVRMFSSAGTACFVFVTGLLMAGALIERLNGNGRRVHR